MVCVRRPWFRATDAIVLKCKLRTTTGSLVYDNGDGGGPHPVPRRTDGTASQMTYANDAVAKPAIPLSSTLGRLYQAYLWRGVRPSPQLSGGGAHTSRCGHAIHHGLADLPDCRVVQSVSSFARYATGLRRAHAQACMSSMLLDKPRLRNDHRRVDRTPRHALAPEDRAIMSSSAGDPSTSALGMSIRATARDLD